MATTPTAAPSITQNFKPAFTRIPQKESFDCWLACIATIAGKTLDEVRAVAVDRFRHPAQGPYTFMDDSLIAKLLAHWSFTATVWKESTGIASLPDVCIGLVAFDPETEIGRHVIFVRQPGLAGKASLEYIIDPAYWIDPSAVH
ncbi:MAG: hypothetical protein IPN64_12575 [Propionivibrio sp.]|uniref:hypothetical protein n=1 Tax=Propionivibrio sp. TaxID=2212460 RepID=UPI0025DF6D53|nr:hypothetical protein [Propionivibrio sp.]MBK8894846.1 hypothetical protein [Propionivibrio sp.]